MNIIKITDKYNFINFTVGEFSLEKNGIKYILSVPGQSLSDNDYFLLNIYNSDKKYDNLSDEEYIIKISEEKTIINGKIKDLDKLLDILLIQEDRISKIKRLLE